MVRRILPRDIIRKDYFMGCWYHRQMRYPDYGWNVIIIKPGVGMWRPPWPKQIPPLPEVAAW
jgi:hypothetical protein